MLVDSRFLHLYFRMAFIQIFRQSFPPVLHGTRPPRIKNTYLHTYKQTNKQTNKHRKRQTAVWLRPYVFNIGQKTTTKSTLQSLIGKLVFISKYVRQSRVFISRILCLLRKLKFHHHHVHLNAEFRKDIRWWCRFLRSYNGVSMINTASRLLPGEVFTTDACLSGCGGLCVDQYFHSVFPDFILSQHLDINCLELLTIIVALRLWGTRWKGPRLTVRCAGILFLTHAYVKFATCLHCSNFKLVLSIYLASQIA